MGRDEYIVAQLTWLLVESTIPHIATLVFRFRACSIIALVFALVILGLSKGL